MTPDFKLIIGRKCETNSRHNFTYFITIDLKLFYVHKRITEKKLYKLNKDKVQIK